MLLERKLLGGEIARTQAAFDGADRGRGAAGDAGVQLQRVEPKDRRQRRSEPTRQLHNVH